jgi:hypothetical protein
MITAKTLRKSHPCERYQISLFARFIAHRGGLLREAPGITTRLLSLVNGYGAADKTAHRQQTKAQAPENGYQAISVPRRGQVYRQTVVVPGKPPSVQITPGWMRLFLAGFSQGNIEFEYLAISLYGPKII